MDVSQVAKAIYLAYYEEEDDFWWYNLSDVEKARYQRKAERFIQIMGEK